MSCLMKGIHCINRINKFVNDIVRVLREIEKQKSPVIDIKDALELYITFVYSKCTWV